MKPTMPVFSVVAVSLLLLLFVWERVSIIQLGYDAEQLKQTKMQLEHRHDRLRAKLSRLTAPDYLEQVARTELHMRPPEPGQVVLVRLEPQSGEEGVPQAPMPIEVARRQDTGSLTTMTGP